MPVLLGGGRRLIDDIGPRTSLRFRVLPPA